MATLKIHKVTALPGALVANSLYVVAPPGAPDYVELYFTNAAGTLTKRLPTAADVEAMIAAAVAGGSAMTIVADIAARNALAEPFDGMMVLVVDAAADATVDSGAASYVYRAGTTSWTKLTEFESLDVAIQWGNILNGPTSSAAAIDAAVVASHTHANLTQLGKVGEDGNGDLTYNGQNVRARLEASDW